MSDFTGPDGNGYSFPSLPATAAAQDVWAERVMMALGGGGPIALPGTVNRATVSQLPTISLQALVRAGCLKSP